MLRLCLICPLLIFTSIGLGSALGQQGALDMGLPNSLQFAPEDASFYYAITNNRWKWDQFVNSKAFKALAESEVGVLALAVLREKAIEEIKRELSKPKSLNSGYLDEGEVPDINKGVLAELDYYQSEEGRKLVKFALRALETEAFVYCDARYGKAAANFSAHRKNWSKVIRESGVFPMPKMDPSQFIDSAGTMAGARLKDSADRDFLRQQLTEWEQSFQKLLMNRGFSQIECEFLVGHLKRRTVSDTSDHLVLEFEFDNYPWDAWQVRLSRKAEEEGELLNNLTGTPSISDEQLETIKKRLSGQKAVASIGITGEYLLVAFSDNDRHLQDPTNSKPLLHHASFKPVVELKDKAFSAISYQSGLYRQSMSWVNYAESAISIFFGVALAGPGNEGNKAVAKEIIDEIQESYNPAGNHLSFSYFFEGGIANLVYDYRDHPVNLTARPLVSLKHVGSKPAVVIASTSDSPLKVLLTKWIPRLSDFCQQYLESHIDDEVAEEEEYEYAQYEIVKRVSELLDITKDEFIPSHGNETAFMMDFSQKQTQWHPALPPSLQAIPFPAPALVFEIANAKLFREAWKHYYETLSSIKELHSMLSSHQGQSLPVAIEQTFRSGTYLRLPMIELLGLHPSFQPGLALTENRAIYSLFPAQAENLDMPQTPKLRSPLARIDRPLILATYVDIAQLMDAVKAWHKLYTPVLRQRLGSKKIDSGKDTFWERNFGDLTYSHMFEAMDHVFTLTRSFHTYSSATYIEGNTIITQSAYYFSDTP